MKRIILMFAACVIISGCASISRGPDQQVHLNAFDARTNQVVPADCFLYNEKGITYSKSNKSTIIGRDSGDLNIYCHSDTLDGVSKIEGKVNGGFIAANFFLVDFCTLSCLIDASSGAWSEYPDFLDVSLKPKSNEYRIALETILPKLREQVANDAKAVESPSETLSQNQIGNIRKKLEDSQMALRTINSELSNR